MSFFTDRKLAVKLWPPAVCRHCGGRPEANGLIAHCYICGWAIHRHLNPETGEVVERIPTKERMMGISPKLYRVKPDDQMAVEVTKTNMSDIAKWCGGQVMEGMGMEPGDKGDYLYIPTMTGPISARPGEIVAKDSNGRFNVFDKDRFVAKYEEYGVRGVNF